MTFLTEAEQQEIDFTQSIRKKMIKVLTKGGIPRDDPEKLKVILTALKDHDKSNLDGIKVRLASGEQENESQRILMIAETLRRISLDQSPPTIVGEVELEVLPDNAEIAASIQPGELDLPEPFGTEEQAYDASDG